MLCRMCGAGRELADPPWTSERDGRGETRHLCPDCTRRHARDIEAGLPVDYWQAG